MLLDAAAWAWERVLDVVAWLFPAAEPGTAWSVGRPVLLTVFALVALGALIRIAAWAFRRLTSDGGRTGSRDEADQPLDATTWEERAKAAAGEGRWREAAMAHYQAVLHLLSDAGHLRLGPSKTPGDYRREVRGDPALVLGLAAFVRAFESVAFGAEDPDEEAYRSLEDRARPLKLHA